MRQYAAPKKKLEIFYKKIKRKNIKKIRQNPNASLTILNARIRSKEEEEEAKHLEAGDDHLPGDKLVGNFLLLHTYVLSWEVILDLTVSSYHAFIK